ncbi:MAG: NOB1 family endonuclease [Candidatus Lokiarchaeota archaeon]|nr:NOB1 family endonuclease [Candidatus Lokiarchaeota archaeon]
MTAQNRKKSSILIFDTNIFLMGIDINLFPNKIYTTPEIINEIEVKRYESRNRNIINRIQAAIESRKLMIESPSEKYVNYTKTIAKNTGDLKALSDQDYSIIALALELMNSQPYEIELFTNDYSIQNVCFELNITVRSLFKSGIEHQINFEVYCPHCQTIHNSDKLNDICDMCGSRFKRRPTKDFQN